MMTNIDLRLGRMVAAAEALRRAIADLPIEVSDEINRQNGELSGLLWAIATGGSVGIAELKQRDGGNTAA